MSMLPLAEVNRPIASRPYAIRPTQLSRSNLRKPRDLPGFFRERRRPLRFVPDRLFRACSEIEVAHALRAPSAKYRSPKIRHSFLTPDWPVLASFAAVLWRNDRLTFALLARFFGSVL